MAAHRWADLRESKLSPDARSRVAIQAKAEAIEMTLRMLREASGKTQDEMAELTAMSQSQLSRFERREDYLLSTLKRYVEALGGEIEIVAVLKGRRIKLRGL
jgi:hypothetical protein